MNNLTAESSTKGLEQNPDDRREGEERRKERKKKDGASGDVRTCRAVFSAGEKKRQTGVCEPHLE